MSVKEEEEGMKERRKRKKRNKTKISSLAFSTLLEASSN